MTVKEWSDKIVREEKIGRDGNSYTTRVVIDPAALKFWIESVEDRLRELNPGRRY